MGPHIYQTNNVHFHMFDSFSIKVVFQSLQPFLLNIIYFWALQKQGK